MHDPWHVVPFSAVTAGRPIGVVAVKYLWAHYGGGEVQVGFLVGTVAPGRLIFRYDQVHRSGDVHGGHSWCDVSTLTDGRMRLLEHFRWESREGSGTNVLEEVAD